MALTKEACLFNLIVYAPEKERIPRLLDIIQAISKRFPSRLIFISLDESLQEISIKDSGNSISTPSSSLHKVPFYVMPHIIPDLPITLLWGTDPTKDKTLLPYFQGFATRIIFDASIHDEWSAFGQRMIDHTTDKQQAMIDISWALISGWRDALARLFNDSTTMDALSYCKKIRILCHNSSDYAAGIYLLSWLSSRLHWSLSLSKHCEGVLEAHFNHDKGNLTALITEEPNSKDQEHGISSLEIITQDDDVYLMTHRPPHRTITTHVMHADSCKLPITLPYTGINNSYLFSKELLHHHTGEHYQHMLKALLHFSKEKQHAPV